MQIRSDLDLPTLRILLDPQRTSFTEAVFQVVRGRDAPSEVARCSLGDLGLPNTLTGLRPVDDDRLTVPPRVSWPRCRKRFRDWDRRRCRRRARCGSSSRARADSSTSRRGSGCWNRSGAACSGCPTTWSGPGSRPDARGRNLRQRTDGEVGVHASSDTRAARRSVPAEDRAGRNGARLHRRVLVRGGPSSVQRLWAARGCGA